MHQIRTLVLYLLFPFLFLPSVYGQQPQSPEKKIEDPIGAADQEQKADQEPALNPLKFRAQGRKEPTDRVTLLADDQTYDSSGDIMILTGNVEVSYGDILVIADRGTYNQKTEDLLAEGNVFFEQQGQRIAGERIEFNYKTRRGTIFNSTTFTNRTEGGVTIIIDSKRADKTGDDTYSLEEISLTACQDAIPKWSFTAKRARIRLDHRAQIYNGFFRIKNIPIFYIPFASISISKKDRSSGFLLPSSGSSNIKGRTYHGAYYQTLGRSADLLVRSDLYTKRGVGLGFDFRAKTDQNSRISIGSFIVFDRLLGPKGPEFPDQGGSSFYADAVQHFKNGFVAVADVNITSSFAFRQVFSENILTAISPEERSLFYLNKNWRSFSFNGAVGEQSVFIGGKFFDGVVKTRQLPSVELSKRSTKISESFPAYLSFDVAVDGVRRIESQTLGVDLKTPSIVQRMDAAPKITFPLKSFAGFTLTPSVGVRTTFYSDSLNTDTKQVVGLNLFRDYVDLDLDLRAPAFAKVFRHRDGAPWFKHLIEPFVEYRRIAGIDEFDQTLKIDERDLIANTNELTFGLTNRFFVKRRTDKEKGVTQTHELLELTIAQKYFFDPTFGGALQNGVRNQFFPLNTLSGFSFGGVQRDQSPLNLKARINPTQNAYSDLRINYDTRYNELRDVIVGSGLMRTFLNVPFNLYQSWFYTRRVEIGRTDPLDPKTAIFDQSSFPGNQLDFVALAGNVARGPYGGVIVSYDLRNRNFQGDPKARYLINMTTSAGWAWDCCSLNVQQVKYNIGLRIENRFIFAFTLKGVGAFGTQNIGQRRNR